jgi:hypothetical protein
MTESLAESSSSGHEKTDVEAQAPAVEMLPSTKIKLSLKDVNPIKPIWLIVRRKNNVSILIPSGKRPRGKICYYHARI